VIPIRMGSNDPTKVSASFVRAGVKTQAATYAATKKFGAVLKKRVQDQAPAGASRYRRSITLKTTGAKGNPRATVSRTYRKGGGRSGRPSWMRIALKQTGPEYVAAIAAIPIDLD
jgi:hypothetical protein